MAIIYIFHENRLSIRALKRCLASHWRVTVTNLWTLQWTQEVICNAQAVSKLNSCRSNFYAFEIVGLPTASCFWLSNIHINACGQTFYLFESPRGNWWPTYFLYTSAAATMASTFSPLAYAKIDAGCLWTSIFGPVLGHQQSCPEHHGFSLQYARTSLVFPSMQTHRLLHFVETRGPAIWYMNINLLIW